MKTPTHRPARQSESESTPARSALAFELAAKLPSLLRFGGSSWTYPGWQGLVYHHHYPSKSAFTRDSLREYAQFPLFRTVGIDSSFYRPLSESQWQHYSALVPQNFCWVSKVWEHITAPAFPAHPRYGKAAGTRNPEFLNADLCKAKVLAPCSKELRTRFGPFIFQFPYIAPEVMGMDEFLERLDSFLSHLPKEFRYATEIRNPNWLGAPYFSILNRHGTTHCFNHWFRMPSLRTQMCHAADSGGLAAPFFVARLLTPLGVSYEQAVKMHAPYREIRTPNPDMRRDVVRLMHRALQRQAEAFILVNNRCEGCSPLTIDAIVRLFFETQGSQGTVVHTATQSDPSCNC